MTICGFKVKISRWVSNKTYLAGIQFVRCTANGIIESGYRSSTYSK